MLPRIEVTLSQIKSVLKYRNLFHNTKTIQTCESEHFYIQCRGSVHWCCISKSTISDIWLQDVVPSRGTRHSRQADYKKRRHVKTGTSSIIAARAVSSLNHTLTVCGPAYAHKRVNECVHFGLATYKQAGWLSSLT